MEGRRIKPPKRMALTRVVTAVEGDFDRQGDACVGLGGELRGMVLRGRESALNARSGCQLNGRVGLVKLGMEPGVRLGVMVRVMVRVMMRVMVRVMVRVAGGASRQRLRAQRGAS